MRHRYSLLRHLFRRKNESSVSCEWISSVVFLRSVWCDKVWVLDVHFVLYKVSQANPESRYNALAPFAGLSASLLCLCWGADISYAGIVFFCSFSRFLSGLTSISHITGRIFGLYYILTLRLEFKCLFPHITFP